MPKMNGNGPSGKGRQQGRQRGVCQNPTNKTAGDEQVVNSTTDVGQGPGIGRCRGGGGRGGRGQGRGQGSGGQG